MLNIMNDVSRISGVPSEKVRINLRKLAANRPDVCAGYHCHALNSGFALRTDPWHQHLTANSDRLSHPGRRMSLFLQTLVLRGILFREHERHQDLANYLMFSELMKTPERS